MVVISLLVQPESRLAQVPKSSGGYTFPLRLFFGPTDIATERKSMLESKLIDMLRCPIDGSGLQLLTDEEVARINLALETGGLRDRLDQRISSALDAGLLNRQANRVYPVRGGIPSLVADEAVDLPERFFEEGLGD